MSGVVSPGELNIEPCTRGEDKSAARWEGVIRIRSCVMYKSSDALSVFLLPPRLSATLYFGWAGHLPIGCQHRRYGTGRGVSKEGGYCGMSLRIWRQACMCTDNSCPRLPRFSNSACTLWKRAPSSLCTSMFLLDLAWLLNKLYFSFLSIHLFSCNK